MTVLIHTHYIHATYYAIFLTVVMFIPYQMKVSTQSSVCIHYLDVLVYSVVSLATC